ncbi:STAS domain-containing protein [Oceanimonas sp. CHS3-5]|uniref:STAS domain-containing protein n=1 Tax=Oceanimonas sp. CHS3-5 TaxID=3068186 RepID=UPI00273E1556|nr:STAS domain-containing protein [Oceanimonas sp. CHS3-5]MDP5293142.1 STAS domain-containing protein [Oceanimonas sp. CHS3-5]
MKLTRPLTREQLPAWWAERDTLFAETRADLSAVERIDSVGLALLVQWSQALAARDQRLALCSPPDSFYPLADLYGVSSLFELPETDSRSQHGSE